MKKKTTPTSTRNITITPTHTLIGDEAINSSDIGFIHLVLEDGTIYDIDEALSLLSNKHSRKVSRPWPITTRLKRGVTAFRAAIEETQAEQQDIK